MIARLCARPAAAALAIALALSGLLPPGAAGPAGAAEAAPAIDEGYVLVRDLLSDDGAARRSAAARLAARGDRGLVYGIVDALFFIAKPFRGEAFETLEALTGEKPGRSYWDWVEVAGRLEAAPAPGYAYWKASLFSHLDPGYRRLLDPEAPRTLRLEEVVSGGVRIEGIPSLDDPAMVAAAEADYLRGGEQVFGVYWQGEARAYPRRFLDWHEMLNDRVGGEPISLAYCTLCGAGVVYRSSRADGPPFRFATSGLLYRSNKLMFDRESGSLWSQLQGEPVLGPLVGRGLALPLLPHVRTTWDDWRRRHPQTLVMAYDRRLRETGLAHRFDYAPGEADRARRGVHFPVWTRSSVLPAGEEVFGLRAGGAAKAYAAAALLAAGLLNDELDGRPVLLLADRASGAVRAYLRPPEPLARSTAPDLLETAGGVRYRATELALEPLEAAGEPPAPSYARLPGHFAFWFGWYAFFPHTAVWPAPAGP